MRVAILGAQGRMGQELIKSILEHPTVTLFGAAVRPESPSIGQDVGALLGMGPLGVFFTDNLDPLFQGADCLIDFTSPFAMVDHLKRASHYQKPFVIGTTGFSYEEETALKVASQKTPILCSSNMSLGVALLAHLVKKASALLPKDFQVEIMDKHHQFKRDAPSGTALLLGKKAAEGRGLDFSTVAVYDRTKELKARAYDEIGFSVVRGGGLVGDHSVFFLSNAEVIELSHQSLSRRVFAEGALRAASWLCDQEPGLYDISDVLGLS